MIVISHRGNINGPNPDTENMPEIILNTINNGFNVEVDVWFFNNKIYLGHDGPQYLVDTAFIILISKMAWFHCKNLNAINFFIDQFPTFNFFWHQGDDYTLTSNNYIWTYPERDVSNKSIIVDLDAKNKYSIVPYGICTDYPQKIKDGIYNV